MSDRVEDEAEFWLPAEFLTDEDMVMADNKENLNKNTNTTHFRFPSDFSFDFQRDDNDHQLTELTSQLTLHPSPPRQNYEKRNSRWGMAGSPQSTLVQFGCMSGRSPGSSNGGSPNAPSKVASPPTSPLGSMSDARDLIYQAAGQVARLKMSGVDVPLLKDRNLFAHQQHPQSPPKNPSALYNSYVQQVREEQMLNHHQQQQHRCGVWSSSQVRKGWFPEHPQRNRVARLSVGGCLENEQVAWPVLQNQQNRSVMWGSFVSSGSGSGVKRPCAGTGVFLPRRYGSNNNGNNIIPAEPRKRPFNFQLCNPGCSTAPLPARVVQGVDRNMNCMTAGRVQPRFNGGFRSEYDLVVARRHAMLMQQSLNLRAAGGMSHDTGLPQEWTY